MLRSGKRKATSSRCRHRQELSAPPPLQVSPDGWEEPRGHTSPQGAAELSQRLRAPGPDLVGTSTLAWGRNGGSEEGTGLLWPLSPQGSLAPGRQLLADKAT